MDIFWLIVAGLIVVAGLAAMFVLLPILRKKQANKPDALSSITSILAGSKGPAVIAIVSALLFSAALLFAWSGDETTSPTPAVHTTESTAHTKATEELAARLKLNPSDGIGWAMLARTYAITGRYPEAVEAYEKAANLTKTDAVLLVDYADVLALVNGKNMQGKPLELIGQALKIDPDNVKGLALMGTAEFQAGNYSLAENYWGRLLPKLPQNSEFAKQISTGISDARARAAGQQGVAMGSAVGKGNVAHISGVVKLSPALSGKVESTDTVFVFAKAASGSPMPIAVIRAKASNLPFKFSLDDSMAMMPAMKLSDHKTVMVSAKISKSGNATQQSGDLKGEVSSVKVGAEDVQVLIDKVVP